MSAPAPFTVKTPFDTDAAPAMPTGPTSLEDHPDGAIGNTVGVRNWNSPWFSVVGSWLVTATPYSAMPEGNGVDPTVWQGPVVHTYAVTTPRSRIRNNSPPGVGGKPAMNVVGPPGVERVMNSIPPSGFTSRITCGEPGSRFVRIMIPTLAKGFVAS